MTPDTASPAHALALVEDDGDLAASMAQLLTLSGYAVSLFTTADAALARIGPDWPGIVISDVRLPGTSGIELLRTLRQRDPALPVILVTGHGDVAMAVDALKDGAWDFLTKPFAPESLLAAAERAATARALALENRRLLEGNAGAGAGGEASALIGQSPAIRRLRAMIPVLAQADMDLFIEGETGTGKDLFARLVHRAGKRARHRLLGVPCAALPDPLQDALFAPHGDASVTTARRGTLLLDDIDLAPATLQARLVPLAEERVLRAPSLREPLPLECRIVATGGTVPGDPALRIAPALFYRIAALRLVMPPLRERREDIPALFAHLADAAATRMRRPMPVMTGTVRDHLIRHDWPGNVRELAHFADRFVLGLADAAPQGFSGQPAPGSGETLGERVDAFERETIVAAIRASGGEIGVAIRALGLPRKTFYYKVHKHGIDLTSLRQEG
ncbi:MAG: sigma-54 dependent transcriptional regulator [Novosphingobium aromaticivorans]|nr:sigma-54 dependent transcriptional regulator [Novosphingobium aromaticivorans]